MCLAQQGDNSAAGTLMQPEHKQEKDLFKAELIQHVHTGSNPPYTPEQYMQIHKELTMVQLYSQRWSP